MGMCINRNVLIGLAVAAGGVLVLAPQAFVAALPVLFLLACPLSMIVMMRGMTANQCSSSSQPQDTATPARTDDRVAEVARLQAEIDQLRAERRDRPQDRVPGEVDW